MAKFGLYFNAKPCQVYEGDNLIQDGDMVRVIDEAKKVVAVINLPRGARICKINEQEAQQFEQPSQPLVSRLGGRRSAGPHSWMGN